jgi:hypothetical protein
VNTFLQRISSRKFLLALAAQVAAVVAIFAPAQENQVADAAQRIAGLVVLLLAGLGYGVIEADVDKAALPETSQKQMDEPR